MLLLEEWKKAPSIWESTRDTRASSKPVAKLNESLLGAENAELGREAVDNCAASAHYRVTELQNQ